MTGQRKRAPYGRKKHSGQAALATYGDGWGKLARYPQARGPFDLDPTFPGRPLVPSVAAEVAFDIVKRRAA